MVFKNLALGAALILAVGSTTAAAQTQAQDDVYALSYFSNANTKGAPDAALRVVNDGFVSDASPAGDLCASVYVFDTREELSECCSCKITPNGILSLSVDKNLTSSPLIGITLTRGIVKVVSSFPVAGHCDPTTDQEQEGIRGWITHVQKATTGYSLTEEELMDSNLGTAEAANLAEDCKVIQELASGWGDCSCTDSGQ